MRNKKYHFIVKFTNNLTTYVSCANTEEAEILAKAYMIKNTVYTYEIKSITKTDNISDMADADFIVD